MNKQTVCPSCNSNPKKVSKNGLQGYYCIQCERSNSTRWRSNNHPARLLSYAKSRCKKSGHACTITKEDIVVPEICPILGIKIDCTLTGKAKDSSPSLHRVNPTKGYTIENIIVCSWRANDLLKDMSLEESILLTRFLSH